MKLAVVLYDGMADYPVPALGGKTPMEAAHKPLFDSLGQKGETGIVRTVAPGIKPGSDVANLSVLGYDPKKYHTGRSPLEAASLGIDMEDTDISLRCNLVTLSDATNYDEKIMVDYSAGDISTAEAAELIRAVEEHFGSEKYAFYSGVAYRHCLIVKNGTVELGKMTPPHDISGKVIGEYLSTHENARELIEMMKESYDFLMKQPVNLKRISEGKLPANSIWLWGEGTKTILPSFESLYGIKGSIISAVDLLKGIAKCAKMNAPDVEGATGYIDTNFEGKAKKAVEEWENGADLVYLHFEAPDECGHRGEAENKVKSIEYIDSRVLPIILDYLEKQDDFKIMILPDHPTPIVTLTHASDPVPYMIYQKSAPKNGVESVNENSAKESGIFIDYGPDLMKKFLESN